VSSAVARLGEVIGTACTINEPNVIGVMGYMQGEYPPGVKDDFTRHLAVNDVMVRAHRLAVDALRAGPGSFPVGLTLSMDEMVANAGGEGIRDAAEEILENTFLRACAGDDFVGVQTYTRIHFDTHGKGPDDPDVPVTQMGYENWPPALAHTVRRTAAFTGLPVLVTENGIATADDAERIAFMDAALRGVGQCIRDGVDVRGYFAWSLLDNFEWNQGYRPTFGLVSVDRATFARTLKPSATWLGRVAQANVLA
jgi:beta-glucosidase